MKKCVSLLLVLVFIVFNCNIVFANTFSLSSIAHAKFENFTYTDNSFLPDTYHNGIYDNYALFVVRVKGGSSITTPSYYLYCFCYNKTFGIEPFYLVETSSSYTGYYLKTVLQYSSNNLSDTYGRWYSCDIDSKPSSINWVECPSNYSGFQYGAINCYMSSSHNTYTVNFLKYDYALNNFYKLDGQKPSYNDSYNNYTIYATYLLGTANFYTDDTQTDLLFDSNIYDVYGDIKIPDDDITGDGDNIDYGSGGVFSWIGDFFKTLIDKVSDIPNAIGKFFDNLIDKVVSIPNAIGVFFDNLISIVLSIPSTIMELLSNLLQFLFVPNSEFFSDIKDEFINKFEFAFQIVELSSSLLTKFDNASDSIPKFDVALYNKNYDIIDFSMFTQYRSFVHGIIIAISYYKFVIWLIRNVPNVLHGFGSMDRG